jgi:hypothetical protein
VGHSTKITAGIQIASVAVDSFSILKVGWQMCLFRLKTAVLNVVATAALVVLAPSVMAKNPPVSGRLSSGVIQSTDLPPDWAEDSDPSADWVGPPICGVALTGASAGKFASFRDLDNGSVQSVALQFPPGRAEKILNALTAKMKKGCNQTIPGPEGERPLKVRVGSMSVGAVGEQRTALRISSPAFTTEALIARKGDVLIFVSSSRFAGSPIPVADITLNLTKRFLNK